MQFSSNATNNRACLRSNFIFKASNSYGSSKENDRTCGVAFVLNHPYVRGTKIWQPMYSCVGNIESVHAWLYINIYIGAHVCLDGGRTQSEKAEQ